MEQTRRAFETLAAGLGVSKDLLGWRPRPPKIVQSV